MARNVAAYYAGNNRIQTTPAEKAAMFGYTPSDKELQTMSMESYKGIPSVPGMSYDKALSNGRNAVFVRKHGRVVVLAVRGTRPTAIRDIGTDVALANGELTITGRYKESQRVLDRIVRKYPKSRIYITGHSLGASIARDLSRHPRVSEAVGFNTGYSVNPVSMWRDRNTRYNRFHDYINGHDLVSAGMPFHRGTHYVYNRSWGLRAHRPIFT